MTKRFICLALLLAFSLLAACGQIGNDAGGSAVGGGSREEAARRFLELMLDDDAELQEAVRQSAAAINEGMIAPTAEQRQAISDTAARLDELLRAKFGGLLSERLLDSRIKDGSLSQYQRLLGNARCIATLGECDFTQTENGLDYEAQVACEIGGESQDIPISGRVSFDEDGRIDYFNFDTLGQLSLALALSGP